MPIKLAFDWLRNYSIFLHRTGDKVMNELISLAIPKTVENLQLPDPNLLDYYKDAGNRVFWLEGEVCCDTLDIVKSIMRCNLEDADTPVESRVPIKLFIDTNGGDVQVMWVLINAIKISKTPVYTIVYCNALSAGAHILAAGHKRFAFPGSTVLVHSGSCQFGGDMEKVESAKRYFDALGKKANERLLADTSITAKDLKKKGAIDWYMTAEDALENGMIDKIIEDFTEVL